VYLVLPGGSGGLRADVRFCRASSDNPGEAEVGELGLEAFAEEDVAGLDVAVEHGRVPAVVEELERGGSAARDAEPRGPGERIGAAAVLGVGAVEPGVEASALQELVDEDAVAAGGAVAQQAREVRVAEAAEHLELGAELAVAGGRVAVAG